MNEINPKINIYKTQPNFKAASAMPYLPGMQYADYENPTLQTNTNHDINEMPAVELPDIYYSPNSANRKESIAEKVKKVDVMDLITPWFEHPLMMLGTCFGISYGVDAFSKSCNKEYEKSILGKAAKFGDKIENSKAIQSKPVQEGLGWIRTGWRKVKDTAMKNSVIRSMFETPSMPENPMPKSEMVNTEIRAMEKFGEIVNKLGLIPGDKTKPLRLKDLHLNSKIIKELEKDFGVSKLSDVAEEKVVSRYLLKQAGIAESEIKSIVECAEPVKKALEKVAESVGGEAKLKEIISDQTGKYRKEILEICQKLKGITINQGTKIPGLTKQPLTNEAGFQEVYNRIYSLGEGAATKTGAFMSKLLQKIHRGFTFGGAKTGVMLFVAPLIVRTLLNTHKAEKDEKVGTFAHGMIEAVSWVFTFPLILKGIHALGGIQYAGMGKDKVAALKNEVANFNKRVANGEFKSFAEWKAAKKVVKDKIAALRHVENQDFITRCLRGISKFTKSDLLKLDRFKDKSFFKNLLRNGPANAKNFIWSAGRFMVFMMVGMPLVDKLITKCTNALFGRHYDDMIEKENAEAKKKQKEFLHEDLQNRMYEAQARKLGMASQAKTNLDTMPEEMKALVDDPKTQAQSEIAKEENQPAVLTEQAAENSVQDKTNVKPFAAKQSEVIKRDNYTYIPSQENVLKKPEAVQVNKYIPSQMPGNVGKVFDNSGLEAALRRADRAETRALQTLAGKFPN